MNSLLLAAFVVDGIVGDPPALPHPVRGIGAAIAAGEARLRRVFPATPGGERAAGAILTAVLVATAGAAGAAATAAARAVPRARHALLVVIAASTLATRTLLAEAASVLAALDADDLALARTRVARIVGRDTAVLDAAGIAAATIETLAESTCDGVVAPLVYLALAGIPGGFAFKAISTLDSMIGHIEMPYRDFGAVAARLDDLANFVPARGAAVALALAAPVAGGSTRRSFQLLRSDGANHASPNAGRPEAAMAGALDVRLGGPRSYDGVLRDAPAINEHGRVPGAEDVRRAIRLSAAAAALTALVLAVATRER